MEPALSHLDVAEATPVQADADIGSGRSTPRLRVIRAEPHFVTHLAPAARSRLKRAFDVVVAGAFLVLLGPPLLLVALIIRVTSPGPALFRQERTGLGGKTFSILKFRTMVLHDHGNAVIQATHDDVRITAFGKFLRATSIDELPQLLNVIKGEMSLIGPRPHALTHDRQFSAIVANYPHRFSVRPGLTGLAQVRGHAGPTPRFEHVRNRVKADIEYVDTWSHGLDFRILISTIPMMLFGRGAI